MQKYIKGLNLKRKMQQHGEMHKLIMLTSLSLLTCSGRHMLVVENFIKFIKDFICIYQGFSQKQGIKLLRKLYHGFWS